MTPVSGAAEPADELEEHVDLGVVERRGRLVHDEHLASNDSALAISTICCRATVRSLDALGRVEREAEPVEQLPCAPVQGAVVEEDARPIAARAR